MERIKLNLIPSGVAPIVHLSQYDDGRQFGIDLFEGESVYVLDGTETLTVNSRKPDGHVVTLTVTNTGTSSLDVDTVEQLTAVHGVSYAKLKIEKGSVTIATLPFLIDVSRDPLENGDPSESFVDNLQTQIASAVADQYDADSVVFDANPTAGHGIGFAVTSEGVANAVQDAKDYTDTAIGGLSIPSNITDLADIDIDTPTNGEILVYNNGSWENQANPASTANFAPDYDDTATYNTNDKVIYQGLLYVCLEDSVTGAWDGTKWQNITVADYNAEMLPIESGSATDTKSYIDSGLSGKVNTSDLPMWIKQTSGQSLTIQVPFTFFYYYNDQWQAHIPLPFIAKNNTYTISLTEVIGENIGNITAKCSVISRTTAFFDIQTTKTMSPTFANVYDTCVGRCKFTITFA